LFQIDYHSFAKLILYPEGWQVETPATDAPLMKALVGDSATPAVPGFDPEVSAQLYTTNGDITGDALKYFKTQSFTVELDGGPEQTADTTQFDGGSRYGDPGVYYHRMRAQITGVQTGRDVTVWFTGGGKSTAPFTYHQASDSGADVLLMVAEDYTGNSGFS